MRKRFKTEKAPPGFYVLLAAVLFQGLSGLVGGFGLIMDPTGSNLSIPVEWLDGSPFASYFIPGLILFLDWAFSQPGYHMVFGVVKRGRGSVLFWSGLCWLSGLQLRYS